MRRMCRLQKGALIGLAFVALLVRPGSAADEAPAAVGNSAPTVEATEKSPDESSKPRKPKGRVPREKEAEGTQAPNRFNTDIIFKSKYELNGKPLEVDTD